MPLKPKVYLAVTQIQDLEKAGKLTSGAVFSNKIFRNIILSLAATYGLYVVASLMSLDPWHMGEYSTWSSSSEDRHRLTCHTLAPRTVTSFLQYLLVGPERLGHFGSHTYVSCFLFFLLAGLTACTILYQRPQVGRS
jgi:hypothetical protein